MPCNCGSNNETNLIYACSGAANTGLLADQVMRTLNRDKIGDSTCLAAMGADLSGFLQSARNATRNIVLDGCKVSCGKKIFEKNGIPYQHYIMTDYEVEKGKTPITGDLIEAVAERIADQVKS
ncbi:MAG TPA: putative zinc-binding protein [bacterium]|nr:putative zinc-binding protein [bacterium]